MASFPAFQEEAKRWLSNHSVAVSLLLPLFMIFILFLSRWWFLTTSKNKNPPPSPPKLPIIGNLHQIGSVAHRSFKSLAEKHGPLMLLHVGRQKLLVVSSAETASEVLKTHDAAFCGRPDSEVTRRIFYNLKNISLSPYGDYWKLVRSIAVNQILNQKRVQSFRGVREEEISLLVERIKESCASSSVICMNSLLTTLVNDIVSRITIGKRSSGKGGSRFAELLFASTELFGSFLAGDFFPGLGWLGYITGFEAKTKKIAKDLDQCLENLIEEQINRNKRRDDQRKDNQNFLQVLLELQRTDSSGYALDRESIKAIIMDMVAGGFDTYSLLEWATSLLVKHPDVMKKLQNEVKEVAGSKSFISEDDLSKLQYLKAVIKETFRLCPGAFIVRVSTKDVKIMGYDIAAGTQVLVNALAIGRDPTLWEKPEEFRPERFLNSSIDLKGHHFELLPFGSGRRSCPGSTFALVIDELVLANLVCNFNYALPGGAKAEDLDMTEGPGVMPRRRTPLLLVPSLC